MNIRTDLALECRELAPADCYGIECEELSFDKTQITRIQVVDHRGEEALGKPIGNYVTIEVPPFTKDSPLDEGSRRAVTVELTRMLPKEGTILVAGLGNADITPDALGPKTAEKIFATRHISHSLSRNLGLGKLRPVSVITPGVLGKTGMETVEIIQGAVSRIHPAAVIVIDAMASRRLSRLGCTVQLADTGIIPGSGVGNARKEINENTLGVPVISLGVPTVVDAVTLAADLTAKHPDDIQEDMHTHGERMVVTPREIDTVITNASDLVSLAVNCAMHPHLSAELLTLLV